MVNERPEVPTGWSTTWQASLPVLAPDRVAALQRAASEAITKVQLAARRRAGSADRAMHAKAHGATTTARLRVLAPELPAALQVGPFTAGAEWRTIVRLSTASPVAQAASVPDQRGAALRIVGDGGEFHDILCTTSEQHHARDADALIASLHATARTLAGRTGKLRAIAGLILEIGLRDTLRLTKFVDAARDEVKDKGVLDCTYFSRAPFQLGPYAVKLRLTPANPASARPLPPGDDALLDDYLARRTAGAVSMHLDAHGFVDPASTPLDDHRAPWTSPWLTIATLELPQQIGLTKDALHGVIDGVGALSFTPAFRWSEVAEVLEPLGDLNLLRPHAYRTSAVGAKRATTPPCPALDW